MTNETKNVPELRFPGFEGEWEEKKLGEIGEVTMGQSPNSNQYTDDSEDAILVQGNADLKKGRVFPRVYTKQVTKKAEIGDILLTVRAPVGKIAIAQMDVCIGRGVCAIKSDIFTYYFLEKFNTSDKWKIYSQGSTFESVSGNEIKKVNLCVPPIEERQKIGDFFSKLDQQIELEEKKLALLEKQKKGYMQKIFSQELRFKDENGNEYPEWEEVRLQNIGNTYSGLTGKSKVDFGHGKGEFITYMNVFKNVISNIKMLKKVDVLDNEKQNRVEKNDILFTISSEIPEEVGMCPVWIYDKENVYLNSFCFGYKVNNQDDINPLYLVRYLRSNEMRKKLTILAQGSTRFNISKKEILKLIVAVPNIVEQTEIVKLFEIIEKRIMKQTTKIDKLKIRKKALLQKMFI